MLRLQFTQAPPAVVARYERPDDVRRRLFPTSAALAPHYSHDPSDMGWGRRRGLFLRSGQQFHVGLRVVNETGNVITPHHRPSAFSWVAETGTFHDDLSCGLDGAG